MTTNHAPNRDMHQTNPQDGALIITDVEQAMRRREALLLTLSDLSAEATRDIGGAMNAILADVFAIYLKTKNFRWPVSGPHFHDYHLMMDDQADQLFAVTDPR